MYLEIVWIYINLFTFFNLFNSVLLVFHDARWHKGIIYSMEVIIFVDLLQ